MSRCAHAFAACSKSVQRATARGAVGVASIVMLVFLQMLVVGMIITGARDQSMTVLRLDGTRTQYALDSVSQMALREVYRGVDEDGDGAIGSIAGGVVSSGPLIGGARGAVALASSGSSYTLTAYGAGGSCARASSLGVDQGTASADPVAAYADYSTSTVPSTRLFASGSWGSAVSTGSLSSNVCWSTIRTCPIDVSTPKRSLITLAQDASLWLASYSAGSWNTPSSLTSSAGTCNTKVFAAEYESRTGNLMVVYRKSSTTSLYYRTYTVASPTEQSFSAGLAAAPTWIELAAKPSANEMVAVIAAGTSLLAAVWNGTSWGNSTSLESALPTSGRPFHVAYMNKSGTAMVVWTATSGAPKYRTWNGTSWSSTGTLPAIGGSATAGWIKLEGSPLRSSDEVLMACIGTNSQINVNNWTGTAWGTNTVVETSAAASTEPRVDVAYQPDGVAGLVVWHKSGQNSLRYRTWSGSAWSSQQTGPNMGSEARTIRLGRGRNDTELMMLVRREGSTGYSGYNVFSESGDISTGTTVISGTSGEGGYSLPSPPPATAGSTNLNPSSGTIAPGSYGTLTVGNNVTLGFTAGTYVFTSWTLGNSPTFNFDTSAGPITVNITTSGITGSNTATFTNTGIAPVRINVIDGNVTFVNNTSFTNIELYVFSGDVTFKNNTNGTVDIFASGDITFKNNGTITYSGIAFGVTPRLSAVLWTGGAPGSRVDLSSSLTLAGVTDPCDLASSPLPSSPAMSAWAAVEP